MKVEGGQKYKVKLISTHSSREEIIYEIVSALDHLSIISHQCFSTLRHRINDKSNELTLIQTRLSNISSKVNELKENPKPIQILSSSKFPIEEEQQAQGHGLLTNPFTSFSILQTNKMEDQKTLLQSPEFYEFIRMSRLSTTGATGCRIKNIDELLQYYHVRNPGTSLGSSGNNTNNFIGQLGTNYEIGLGNPSPGLRTIDSFFLFNTTENPYQNYRVAERYGAATTSSKASNKKNEIQPSKSELNPEDSSNDAGGNGEATSGNLMNDIYYYPSVAKIPQLDIPDHLPNLPGLANTLDFSSMESSNSLFPIVTPRSSPNPVVPSRVSESISASSTMDQPISNKQPQPSDVLTGKTELPKTQSFIPPPPPPMPGTMIIVKSVIGGIPPPPPPPPPPMPQGSNDIPPKTGIPSQNQEEKPKPKVKGGGQVDLRSCLMEAIREAGGKPKLKSFDERKIEAKRKKQEEKEKAVENSGSDMMADLKNTLAMRRRGISGMNDVKPAGIGDIMKSMVTRIPLHDDSVDSNHGVGEDDDDWD